MTYQTWIAYQLSHFRKAKKKKDWRPFAEIRITRKTQTVTRSRPFFGERQNVLKYHNDPPRPNKLCRQRQKKHSFLTFPELLTSMGKEQKRKTPRARSSSGQLFTLKALGSSKASVADRRSAGLSTAVLEATVPTSLTGDRWADSRRTREQIIVVSEVFVF